MRLVEIILEGRDVTYKTVALLAKAENKINVERVYDSNHTLKMIGLRELTPAQLELFEAFWNSFIDLLTRDASQDDVIFWIMYIDGDMKAQMKKDRFKRGENGLILPVR